MRSGAALLAALLFGAGKIVLGQEPAVEPAGQRAGDPYAESTLVWLCPDHRGHPEEEPGACALCGRPREPRRLVSLWSCPMHPQMTERRQGICPVCGMALTSTTQELEWFCATHPDVVRPEPGACPRDGTALSVRGRSLPHGDHNPRHGGLLFMAADRFHHLEGALGSDGTFRLFFYDDFTRPLDARTFRARVGEQELQASADGASLNLAAAGAAPRPLELTVHVRFPSAEREELFDFVLDDERASPATTATAPSPTDSAGLLEAIRARSRRVDDLVRRGAWPDLFIPALEAKDLALALLEREGERVGLPVKTLVRAAWLLDLYGDLGKKAEVETAHRLFAQGVADLEKAHGR